jgi:asparagine synthase (glutamine-hydrolysing)
VHPLGAAALAGARHATSLVHEDGLLVMCRGPQASILAGLWRSVGAEACAALSGHFAFALFDARSGEGLLAVDRCASRPLFYQRVGRTLVFASSMEGLARHPGAGQVPDPQAIFDYLYLDGASGPRPLLAGQHCLGPGEYLHLRAGCVERGRYWRMRYVEHDADAHAHELLDALSGALVPAGRGAGLLFGGGHASMLVGTVLRQAGHPLHTYTLGFGASDRGALARAAAAARRLGSRHRCLVLGPADLVEAVPLLARHADGPCGDPGAVSVL